MNVSATFDLGRRRALLDRGVDALERRQARAVLRALDCGAERPTPMTAREHRLWGLDCVGATLLRAEAHFILDRHERAWHELASRRDFDDFEAWLDARERHDDETRGWIDPFYRRLDDHVDAVERFAKWCRSTPR